MRFFICGERWEGGWIVRIGGAEVEDLGKGVGVKIE